MRGLAAGRSVAEAHGVDASGTMWRTCAGLGPQILKRSVRTTANHMVHQMVTQHPTGVPQPFGMLPSGRIQQYARGLQRLSAQHDGLPADLLRLLCRAVHERDATCFVASIVHVDVADDR